MLSIRELQNSDISSITAYWSTQDNKYWRTLGVDLTKIPDPLALTEFLRNQIAMPVKNRQSMAVVWNAGNSAIGHCNVTPFTYGDQAHIHVHIWDKKNRKMGYANQLLPQSIAFFFKALELKNIFAEPFAENPGPNKLVAKLGFTLEATYHGFPHSMSFEQQTNQWILSRKKFLSLYPELLKS